MEITTDSNRLVSEGFLFDSGQSCDFDLPIFLLVFLIFVSFVHNRLGLYNKTGGLQRITFLFQLSPFLHLCEKVGYFFVILGVGSKWGHKNWFKFRNCVLKLRESLRFQRGKTERPPEVSPVGVWFQSHF